MRRPRSKSQRKRKREEGGGIPAALVFMPLEFWPFRPRKDIALDKVGAGVIVRAEGEGKNPEGKEEVEGGRNQDKNSAPIQHRRCEQ